MRARREDIVEGSSGDRDVQGSIRHKLKGKEILGQKPVAERLILDLGSVT